ncbi:hypothetical protein [Streptomyces telluris]|uniref:Uncharacterized protein n=1 Tax=Streptomyces telluris TaxID=2720021 RepID=A0A9X2RPU8_9ACTN|nr:hypothetical protein [Streptomyces telluris]MCQ8773519.1 hypothetical protein [Streptomyces telluris]
MAVRSRIRSRNRTPGCPPASSAVRATAARQPETSQAVRPL